MPPPPPIFLPSWTTKTHIVPASHPRGYVRSVRNPATSRLQLVVKQYIPPATLPASSPHGISLILVHGMPPGANKETSEPFLWDLMTHPCAPPISSFWAFDAANVGESYVLNETELGEGMPDADTARDLLKIVDWAHEKGLMGEPVIGYGHSWGFGPVARAASWSPRAFRGVGFCEPAGMIENGYFHIVNGKRWRGSTSPLGMSFAVQRQYFSTWDEVKKYMLAQQWHRDCDPRVFDQALRSNYREVQVETESGVKKTVIKLVTPPAQILPYFIRPDPALPGEEPDPEWLMRPESSRLPFEGFHSGAKGLQAKYMLGSINCKVLYIWQDGQDPWPSDQGFRDRLAGVTGTGYGGAGGRASGQVVEREVKGGHALPQFQPTETAACTAMWLRDVWTDWRDEVQRRARLGEPKPDRLGDEFWNRAESGGALKRGKRPPVEKL